MSSDESYLKDKADCGCGCGLYGTLKKPNRAGVRCVARGCKCNSCRGKRSHAGGHKKQNTAVRKLGIPVGRFAPTNEESLAGYFDVEVKSGKQVGPVATWWKRTEDQVLTNQADFGSLRKPVLCVAMPEGMSDGLVVMRLSAYAEHVRPALTEFYGTGA
jgi:hypothetical protein